MKYKINTDVFGGSRIVQELSSVDEQGQVTRLSRWIVDTREREIQEVLKQLGWTPPDEGQPATQARLDKTQEGYYMKYGGMPPGDE